MLRELVYTEEKEPLSQGVVQSFHITFPNPSIATPLLFNEDVEKWLSILEQIESVLSQAGNEIGLSNETVALLRRLQNEIFGASNPTEEVRNIDPNLTDVYQKIDRLPTLVRNSLLAEDPIEAPILDFAKKFINRFYRLLNFYNYQFKKPHISTSYKI